MIRLIVLVVIGYLAYRLAKKWITNQSRSYRVDNKEKDLDRIDDVMVKDPQCGTYFPRRDGFPLKTGESDLLFCSRECREKYVAASSQSGE